MMTRRDCRALGGSQEGMRGVPGPFFFFLGLEDAVLKNWHLTFPRGTWEKMVALPLSLPYEGED